MTLPATQRFFQGSPALPMMPEVAQRLLATFGNERVSIGELVALVGHDASLSARLLRMANTPRFTPSQRVTRLSDAAHLIGLVALRGLALSASLVNSFPHPPGFDRLRFWRQNLATAGYARWLASALQLNAGLAEVGGLVLRSGQLLMLMQAPGQMTLVESLSGTPDSVFDLERLHFGCTQAEVSAELAVRWRFPLRLVDALNTAGDPLSARPFSPEGAVLRAASVMADAADDGFDPLAQLLACQPALVHGMGMALDELAGSLPSHAQLTGPLDELLR